MTKPVEPPAKPEAVAPKHPVVEHAAAPKVGKLAVSANVNGAKISIDGRTDPNWLTPYTIEDLPAGTHNIRVSMEGYDSSLQSVTVTGGETASVQATLTAPTAELDVITNPAGVEVLVDGKSYDRAPCM